MALDTEHLKVIEGLELPPILGPANMIYFETEGKAALSAFMPVSLEYVRAYLAPFCGALPCSLVGFRLRQP